MALEAVVFQQDPFSYADWKDYCNMGDYSFDLGIQDQRPNTEQISNGYWDSTPSSIAQSSSPEICAGQGIFSSGEYSSMVDPAVDTTSQCKRRRTKSSKNKEEIENQRMTHIAVERNRRRQMNDYLAILRSLMPPSYAQRGDQASIVGGAINFVKELEQLLQSLEAYNVAKKQHYTSISTHSHLFSRFFTFPQYSTYPTRHGNSTAGSSACDMAEKRSAVADIEVTMVENHANIKILSGKLPKQILKLVTGLQSISLTVLHLNITTIEQLVLYSISVKVEDDCQLSTVTVIANAVHDMLEIIQEEARSS
ncbi:transcription factor bHLH96-like [Olea europaea var. sylvestris]|uniref:Transcription factor bHLH96-like n=1 Tax=Olea europaea subsp. europaea TaxID=158383 RepID=A0A8S0SEU2_OLEEU|nr:transcription factor bHLH96-like [Olea europaea var. sylvestris]CAA2991310.1 transcription factor bHLH96-like [Olea europaea subsp. europaea]